MAGVATADCLSAGVHPKGMKTKLLPGPSPCTPPVTGKCSPSSVSTGVESSSGRTGSGPGMLLPYVGNQNFCRAGQTVLAALTVAGSATIRADGNASFSTAMIGVRVRHVSGGQVFLRLENLRRQTMSLAETELRIDDQHILLARNHGGIHVVAIDAAAGVISQLELRLGTGCRGKREQDEKSSGDMWRL